MSSPFGPEYFKPKQASTDELIKRIEWALEVARDAEFYMKEIGTSQQYATIGIEALTELENRIRKSNDTYP